MYASEIWEEILRSIVQPVQPIRTKTPGGHFVRSQSYCSIMAQR